MPAYVKARDAYHSAVGPFTGEGRNEGLRSMLRDPAALSSFNEMQNAAGSGITASVIETPDKRKQMMFSNAPVRAAEGAVVQPQRWEDTDRYKESIARTQQLKAFADELAQDRVQRSLASAHPFYQQQGMRELMGMQARAQREAAQARARQASGEDGLTAFQQYQILRDAQRDEREARNEQMKRGDEQAANLDKMLSGMASSPNGKETDQRQLTTLRDAAARWPGKPEWNTLKRQKLIADQMAIEDLLENQGRHLFASEGRAGLGQRVKKTTPTLFDAIRRGAMPGQGAYTDEAGRMIFERDLARLTPDQRELFLSEDEKYGRLR
jgi:hypothetical protein